MKMICRAALGLVSIIAIFASVLLAQPENITINNVNVYKSKQRPQVEFPHGIHMESDLSCTDCHHRYQDGKNVLDEDDLEEGGAQVKCSSCHERSTITGNNLREAFHLQCIGCHRKMKKEGKKSGPRLCAKCHPWK